MQRGLARDTGSILCFPHLTRPEVSATAKDGQFALISAGTIEVHGPRLLLGTNVVMAEAVCERLVARIPDWVGLMPTITIGFGPRHMDVLSIITSEWSTLIDHALDVMRSTACHRVDWTLIVNAPGSNSLPLDMTARLMVVEQLQVQTAFLNCWSAAAVHCQGGVRGHDRIRGAQPCLRGGNLDLFCGGAGAGADGQGWAGHVLRAFAAHMVRPVTMTACRRGLQAGLEGPDRPDRILKCLDYRKRARRSEQGDGREGEGTSRFRIRRKSPRLLFNCCKPDRLVLHRIFRCSAASSAYPTSKFSTPFSMCSNTVASDVGCRAIRQPTYDPHLDKALVQERDSGSGIRASAARAKGPLQSGGMSLCIPTGRDRKKPQSMGRSLGGWITKPHMVPDGHDLSAFPRSSTRCIGGTQAVAVL